MHTSVHTHSHVTLNAHTQPPHPSRPKGTHTDTITHSPTNMHPCTHTPSLAHTHAHNCTQRYHHSQGHTQSLEPEAHSVTVSRSRAQTPRQTHTQAGRPSSSSSTLLTATEKETRFSTLPPPTAFGLPTPHPCIGWRPPSVPLSQESPPPALLPPPPRWPGAHPIASAAAPAFLPGDARPLGRSQGHSNPPRPRPAPRPTLPVPSGPHCSLLCPSSRPPEHREGERHAGPGVRGADAERRWAAAGAGPCRPRWNPPAAAPPAQLFINSRPGLGPRPDSPSQPLLSPICGPDPARGAQRPGPPCWALPPLRASLVSPSLTLRLSPCLSFRLLPLVLPRARTCSCSLFTLVHPPASPTGTGRQHRGITASLPPALFLLQPAAGQLTWGKSQQSPGPSSRRPGRPGPQPLPLRPGSPASLTAAHSLFGPRQDAGRVNDTNALQDLIGDVGAHEPGAEGRAGVSLCRDRQGERTHQRGPFRFREERTYLKRKGKSAQREIT